MNVKYQNSDSKQILNFALCVDPVESGDRKLKDGPIQIGDHKLKDSPIQIGDHKLKDGPIQNGDQKSWKTFLINIFFFARNL